MLKKINLLFALITLMPSGTYFIANTINESTQDINNQGLSNDNSSNIINWTEVDDYFQNLTITSLNNIVPINNNENDPNTAKALEISKNKSLNYISYMKNNKLGLKKMNSDLNLQNNLHKSIISENNNLNYWNLKHNFQTNYNISKNNNLNYQNLKHNLSIINDNDKEIAESNYDTLIKNLNDANITLATSASIAAIASIGFWAAAWFFGISIPWAVGADAACVALSLASAGISTYLYTLPGKKSIFDNVSWAFSIRSLGYIYKDVIYPIAAGIEFTVDADSWTVPALLGLLGLVGLLFSWISYLQ